MNLSKSIVLPSQPDVSNPVALALANRVQFYHRKGYNYAGEAVEVGMAYEAREYVQPLGRAVNLLMALRSQSAPLPFDTAALIATLECVEAAHKRAQDVSARLS